MGQNVRLYQNAPIEKRMLVYNSSLVGANLERADLRGLDLRGVNLTNANLRNADLSECDLRYATCIKTDFSGATIQRARFDYADCTDSDFTGCYGRGVSFYRARLWVAKLRYAQFKSALFVEADMTGADVVHSLFLGAKFDDARLDGVQNADMATYTWWYSPFGQGPSKVVYKPVPGYKRLDESVTGPYSFRENAARERTEDYVRKGWRQGKGNKD